MSKIKTAPELTLDQVKTMLLDAFKLIEAGLVGGDWYTTGENFRKASYNNSTVPYFSLLTRNDSELTLVTNAKYSKRFTVMVSFEATKSGSLFRSGDIKTLVAKFRITDEQSHMFGKLLPDTVLAGNKIFSSLY